MPIIKKERFSAWERIGATDPSIHAEPIEHFKALGMRSVFWRDDVFGKMILRMAVWLTRDGRVLMRLWSRSTEVDWESYEILGFPETLRPVEIIKGIGDEGWVPECARDEYDNWLICMMPFVY